MQEKIAPQVVVQCENESPARRQIILTNTNSNGVVGITSRDNNSMIVKNSAVVQPMPMYPSPIPNTIQNKPTDFYVPHTYRPSTMTYLSPSQPHGPVMSPFVAPSLAKPVPVDRRPSPRSDGETDKSADEDELIDVVNYSSRSTDTSKTDISMSTQSSASDSSPSTGSNSPSSGSQGSLSPRSNSVPTPDSVDSTRKKARTNYSPDQVQALEKVFHENPYPDPEVMENLSKDLNIPEGKIKVWFQNKRARWRKRVQGNAVGYPAPYMPPMSPFMQPFSPMGFMQGSPVIGGASSPLVTGQFLSFPQPPSSPSSPNPTNKLSPSPMSSPFQSRPQLSPYFYGYPYGLYPPYFCS